jgi:hypothetical protein
MMNNNDNNNNITIINTFFTTPETEVYRMIPEYGLYYEHAEYTRKEGSWSMHNERFFTSDLPRYVGCLIRREEGGWGDSGWRIDVFRNEYNEEICVPYSYEGRTCFRQVPAKKTMENDLK